MTCPKCHSELRPSEADSAERVCPECGARLLRNVSGVMKTSAVMIAARGESGFYRSVQDVPEPLRTQLIETTTSPNSGIIVIADKAGKEQLTHVTARRDSGRQDRAESGEQAPEPKASAPEDLSLVVRPPFLAWVGLIVVLTLAVLLFIFFFHSDWSAFPLHW